MKPALETEVRRPTGKPVPARVYLSTEKEALAERPGSAAARDAFLQHLGRWLSPAEIEALRGLDEPLAAWARQAPDHMSKFLADPLGALAASGVPLSDVARQALARLRGAATPHGPLGPLPGLTHR